MYELPPVLKGSTQAQVAALRDYLVRMVRMNSSETAGRTETSETSGAAVARASGSGSKGSVGQAVKDEIQKNVDKLRSLIIKTSESVKVEVGNLRHDMEAGYVAVGDFGTYKRETQTTLEANASQIRQLSTDTEEISVALDNTNQTVDAYRRLSHGQIEYGYFEDQNGIKHWGIAIAEQLIFEDGSHDTTTTPGIEYWELNADQTMGLYTSTGWEFWVGGRKVGWFDSKQENGLLHTPSQVTENNLQVNSWLLTDPGSGFGIKYIGG